MPGGLQVFIGELQEDDDDDDDGTEESIL